MALENGLINYDQKSGVEKGGGGGVHHMPLA